MYLPTKFSDRRFRVEQSLRGERAECKNDFRLDELDLPNEVWAARFDFIRQRIAIAGRSMLEDVADENVFSRKSDRRENFCEQLPRRADERPSGFIFRRARR